MKLKTTTKLDAGAIRSVCIKNDWCGCCTCNQYDLLLDMVNGLDITDHNAILPVAQLILKYSDPQKMMKEYNATETEVLENICYYLLNDCVYTYCEITD